MNMSLIFWKHLNHKVACQTSIGLPIRIIALAEYSKSLN